MNVKRSLFDFRGLEAIKRAARLLFSAGSHIKGGNEALSVINSAILLAYTQIWRLSDGKFTSGCLAALKGAVSLTLGAGLEITRGKEAVSKVETAALLADSHHFAGNDDFFAVLFFAVPLALSHILLASFWLIRTTLRVAVTFIQAL